MSDQQNAREVFKREYIEYTRGEYGEYSIQHVIYDLVGGLILAVANLPEREGSRALLTALIAHQADVPSRESGRALDEACMALHDINPISEGASDTGTPAKETPQDMAELAAMFLASALTSTSGWKYVVDAAGIVGYLQSVSQQSSRLATAARSGKNRAQQQEAKQEIFAFWNEWQSGKHRFNSDMQFAIEAQRRWPVVTRADTITKWLAKWRSSDDAASDDILDPWPLFTQALSARSNTQSSD
jgi:hypothetical protein